MLIPKFTKDVEKTFSIRQQIASLWLEDESELALVEASLSEDLGMNFMKIKIQTCDIENLQLVNRIGIFNKTFPMHALDSNSSLTKRILGCTDA